MRTVFHYIMVMPLTYLLSIMPFFVLRRVSDLIFIALYYFPGYRKSIVGQNLANAFPHYSEASLKATEKRFYRHMADVIVETLKLLTISQKSINNNVHMHAQCREKILKFNRMGKGVLITMGHYGSWEWGNPGYHSAVDTPLQTVYHPLSDPFFDKLFLHMRTRFGTHMVKMKDTFRQVMNTRHTVRNTVFIADQSPSRRGAIWASFMGRETAFFSGPEKIARKLNMPVLFASVEKIKRNHYAIKIQVISGEPKNTEPGFITSKYAQMLEERIRSNPQYWLWSHRRWKHSPTPQSNTTK